MYGMMFGRTWRAEMPNSVAPVGARREDVLLVLLDERDGAQQARAAEQRADRDDDDRPSSARARTPR